MSKSIQFKNEKNENIYPTPYFPIGSIYLSVNDTNPTKWFGGSWEQIAKGRTLVGVDNSQTEFNTAKKTGGEKTHTLTVDEMPSHNHPGISAYTDKTGGGYARLFLGSEGQQLGNLGKTGGDQPHNNLPPYFTCYIWLRIA